MRSTYNGLQILTGAWSPLRSGGLAVKNSTRRVPPLTIGMDVGDRKCHLCCLDADGEVVLEAKVETLPEAICDWFGKIEPARVALEAGTHSAWLSRLLEGMNHEVLVANARKLRLIYQNDQKNDRVDAMYLARVARLDPALLCPIKHRSREAQEDLAILRARMALLKARVGLVNHIRSTVKSFGGRLPAADTAYFVRKVRFSIPEGLQDSLFPLLDQIDSQTKQIRKYDKEIERLCQEKYPETERLRQPLGVGPLTALAYVLTLEDPSRFRRSRVVGAFLGLVPRQNASGSFEPQLRITKAGNSYLRQLLVTSAHYVLGPRGPDCDLRRYGEGIAERGGKNAKKRAVVAVARKLAVLLHRLWASGARYRPLRASEITLRA